LNACVTCAVCAGEADEVGPGVGATACYADLSALVGVSKVFVGGRSGRTYFHVELCATYIMVSKYVESVSEEV
jgi:hypothetical protein